MQILANPTLKQEQSNLNTLNQRYSKVMCGGRHFSQLKTMFNVSLNYRF